MILEKFGKTLLLLLFILVFILGAKMALRVADPVIRRVSVSLADALSGV